MRRKAFSQSVEALEQALLRRRGSIHPESTSPRSGRRRGGRKSSVRSLRTAFFTSRGGQFLSGFAPVRGKRMAMDYMTRLFAFRCVERGMYAVGPLSR